MKKTILIIILSILYTQKCFAWVTSVNDDYYQYQVEPKLDYICTKILDKAETLISNTPPTLEVNLTPQERYFSKETMEFLGEDNPQPKYSSVMWRAVWVLGGTIIEGWAKADKKYHVSYIYTVNSNLTFLNGIRVGAATSVLESVFQAKLYDFSAEYGAVGHLQEVWGGDDVLALGLLIQYDNGVITQIMARNEFVEYDSVPLVPSSKKINNFVGEKIDELKQLAPFRGMTVEEAIKFAKNETQQRMPEVGRYNNSPASLPQSSPPANPLPAKSDYDATSIVFTALLAGVTISVLIVCFYSKFYSRKPTEATTYAHAENTAYSYTEPKHEDTTSSRETLNDDFDYPYEDIGEATRL